MKKIILPMVIAMAVTSCFKGTYFEASYNHVATFEYSDAPDLFLKDSSYYKLPFYSDYLLFNNNRTSDGKLAGGFALSVARDSSINLSADPFSMYAKSAAFGSRTSAVFYENNDSEQMPEHDILFEGKEFGTCTAQSCTVNNTAFVVSNIKSEESPLKFESGDWLKVVAKGSLAGKKTGEAEFYLADYRTKDSLVTTWQTFDLSKLGNVDCIDFSIETSKQDFPKYFCMDNLYVSINIKK